MAQNDPRDGDADGAQWERPKHDRKLELQRQRRRHYPRIDYYPDEAAARAIAARLGEGPGGTLSAVINALVAAGAQGQRRRRQAPR